MTVEEVLGTTKDENETWFDVFDRMGKEGQLDFKVLSRIVALILDGNIEKK